MGKKSEIRQASGIRQVAGVMFFAENGEWVANKGPIKLTLDHYGYRCTVTDTRNKYFRGFHTVTAAKLFAKRRRHGRTIVEHQRAEKLKAMQERLKVSVGELAKIIGVSPRTVEAYFTGCRAVPEGIQI